LAIGRKQGEVVYLGRYVCVKVIELQAGRVRLGIAAPENVEVFRGELIELVSEED
jgi:carbon storage regulator CsrA